MSRVIRVKGEGADAYWQRNNTCTDVLKQIILTKITPEVLRQTTHACGGDHAIEGVTQQLQDDCWSKLEHPEWFGKHGSPYFIKPYLALCVKLDLGEKAYAFLNNPTTFPHYFEEVEEPDTPDSYGDWTVYYDASNKKWFLHNEKTATDSKLFDHKPTLEEIKEAIGKPNDDTQQLPCESVIDGDVPPELCRECLDPCNDEERCNLGIRKSMACQYEACAMCEERFLASDGKTLLCGYFSKDVQPYQPSQLKAEPKTTQLDTFFKNQQNP